MGLGLPTLVWVGAAGDSVIAGAGTIAGVRAGKSRSWVRQYSGSTTVCTTKWSSW